MKLSTRMCYGTRALLELSQHYKQGPLPLATIGEHQNLSVKYLEQLMGPLKSANIIESVRGAHGGYTLVRPPEKVRMSDVYHCLEGPNTTTDCAEHPETCKRSPDCPVQPIWSDMHRAIMDILNTVTLKDMANGDLQLVPS